MKRLKTISMKKGLFEEAQSLAITDNAKIEELIIPEGCFPKIQYLSIQGIFLINPLSISFYHTIGVYNHHSIDLPNLATLDIDAGVMEDGGFCVMRSRLFSPTPFPILINHYQPSSTIINH